MVMPKILPKFRTKTRKARARPAREGGRGAKTGNTVAAKSNPIPMEKGIGLDGGDMVRSIILMKWSGNEQWNPCRFW